MSLSDGLYYVQNRGSLGRLSTNGVLNDPLICGQHGVGNQIWAVTNITGDKYTMNLYDPTRYEVLSNVFATPVPNSEAFVLSSTYTELRLEPKRGVPATYRVAERGTLKYAFSPKIDEKAEMRVEQGDERDKYLWTFVSYW
ncbi:hypothetical protein SISSUDRAFT_1048276 [Sistotremastrum suecicum HHB10207 ss-3]|uniref:Ricin B lectin domain-containing protein n=1 Tax=Sistotremastrum suecicum HHB10207 ss-3 TaxID=1314776 RepID=A0A166CK74_9AGAM|nr:hypothetical protein SISSUDRAFT_1048276 [Sistotremastrum suecicum HHB10207 ss-3]